MEYLKSTFIRFEDYNSVNYLEIAGDSSETKPTASVADGSIFTETDTGDVYMFNAKTSAWVKMFGLKA